MRKSKNFCFFLFVFLLSAIAIDSKPFWDDDDDEEPFPVATKKGFGIT
jgi:uncharacterized paraquat-inducible protein A